MRRFPRLEVGRHPRRPAGVARAGHPNPARRRVTYFVLLVAACALATACQSTAVSGLRVRAGPTTDSAIVATMPRAGTGLGVTCQTRGEPIHGDPVWYRVTRPHQGYVTHYYIDSRQRSPQVPPC